MALCVMERRVFVIGRIHVVPDLLAFILAINSPCRRQDLTLSGLGAAFQDGLNNEAVRWFVVAFAQLISQKAPSSCAFQWHL